MDRGSCFSRNADPRTLSTALCRPTSSRSINSSPAGVNRPAAWTPPVFSKSFCCSSRIPGSAARTAASIIGCSAAAVIEKCEDLCTASMEAVPQIPHALDVVTCRCAAGAGGVTSGRSCASTTLKVCLPFSSSPAQKRREISCSGSWMMPSDSRNPATKSKSSPGVRIVTLKDSCPSRISSGSSTASASSRTTRRAPAISIFVALTRWTSRPMQSSKRSNTSRIRLDASR